jgi:hypothetical protein
MWVHGISTNYLLAFPDDQNQNSNSPYMIWNDTGAIPLSLCAHQGRVVVQQASPYGHGVNTMTFMGESVVYSEFNDVSLDKWWGVTKINPDTGVTSNPVVFIPEHPTGLAFIVSMSANEMFGVKGDGGFYVSGDFATGAVAVSLPMVTGAELLHTPVVTNIGVIYGNRTSGVWVWPRGDTSQLLSPQMIPDFWVIPGEIVPGSDLDIFGGTAYQFARCDEWVLLPNNFLYDLQLKSWWRLEDEAVARFRYMTATSHFIYGSESFYTNSSDAPIHEWVREDKALSYSWQSHPMWETVDNLVDIRDITLRVAGTGTIKVTATGETGSSFVTFNGINSALPILIRQPFRLQDANIANRTASRTPVRSLLPSRMQRRLLHGSTKRSDTDGRLLRWRSRCGFESDRDGSVMVANYGGFATLGLVDMRALNGEGVSETSSGVRSSAYGLAVHRSSVA